MIDRITRAMVLLVALTASACGPSPPPPYTPPEAPGPEALVRQITRTLHAPACLRATQCPLEDSELEPFFLSELRFFFASQEECMAEFPGIVIALNDAPLLDALAEGRVFYDEASASTCARELGELERIIDEDPCAPAVIGIAPPTSCVSAFRGLVRPGGDCAGSAECQPGLVCEADFQGTCPGACIEPLMTDPDNPDQLIDFFGRRCGGQLCSLGEVCGPAARCVVPKEVGQVCAASVDVCSFGSTCRVLANARSGVCAVDRSVPDGEFCSASAQCVAGSTCEPISDIDPRTTCQARTSPGSLATLGDPCSVGEDLCPFGALCQEGVCVAAVPNGQACADDFSCLGLSSCDDTNLCRDAQLPGAACVFDADCLSFECAMGACTELVGCSI